MVNAVAEVVLSRTETIETEVGSLPADWCVSNIRDLASHKSNATVGGPFGSDLVSADYVSTGVPVIRGQNMAARFVGGDFAFITEKKASGLKANTAYPGDLVFTQRGTLGQVSLVLPGEYDSYVISQSQMKLTPDLAKATPEYLLHWFLSPFGQKAILESAIQTGVPHTNLGILRSYHVPLPPVEEQEAIAAALSDADALIEGLESLTAKKRAIKQGAMQELLSGRRRLPGFNGEWETKCLGEALSIQHGKAQHEVAVSDGPYPILATGGQIGTANSFLYDKPSVLIGRKGTIDRPQYIETPFWTVDTLFYSVIKGRNSAKFFFYRFCLIDWYSHNEASGVPSLNARTIERIEVAVPEPDEQQAIAGLLSDMDEELETLTSRLIKARQIKQGMMQELLTGRVRLI